MIESRNKKVFQILLFACLLVFTSKEYLMFCHVFKKKLVNNPLRESTFCSLKPHDSSMMSASSELHLY